MKKALRTGLLLILCLILSGCRMRTGMDGQEDPGRAGETSGIDASLHSSNADAADEQEKNGEPGRQTKENPEASRKEYDEARPAEILPGAEKTVHSDGEGNGFSEEGEKADQSVSKLTGKAEQTAVQQVPAEEAEEKGISEEAEAADSATAYYTALLQERMGSLFECQRMNVYWETAEDHVTVYKTSAEHRLILNAGAYDVSARLLEENLHVDDGWIGRKNPGVIIKTVDRKVLGTGVTSTEAARRIYTSLLARGGWSDMDAVRNRRVLLVSEEMLEAQYLQLMATLLIAGTANPDQMADVNMADALALLGEEAAGGAPSGIYYYNGLGGS